MAPSIISISFLLLIGAAVAGVLLTSGVAMLILRRRRRKAACGACGYPVAGLQTLRCPECGNDLREVGIKGGRGRHPVEGTTRA